MLMGVGEVGADQMQERSTRSRLALRVAAMVVMAVLIALLTFVPVANNDVWLQAKIGQIIVETGGIPDTLLFPFTWAREYSFNAHEWLPSIVFHLFDRVLGHDGLLFVQGGIGLVLFALCVTLAQRLSGSFAVGLLLAAMAMLVANYRFTLRPELFALLLLMSLLHVLTLYRSRGDWRVLLWALPIGIVWANSHGSVLLGPVVAGLFAVGEAAEAMRDAAGENWRIGSRRAARVAMPYALVALLMALASLVNPQGVRLIELAFTLSGSEVTRTIIGEWKPTLYKSFMTRPPFVVFVVDVLATLAVAAACRRRLTFTDGLLLLAFGALALQRNRFVALFGFVSLVVCSRLIGAIPWRRHWESRALAACVGAGTLGVAFALSYGNLRGAFPYSAPSDDLTEPMLAHLSAPQMQGNVLNSFELGPELIYRFYPRLRPSMDSRIDSYGDRYLLMHEELLFSERMHRSFISDFDIRYMLLTRRDFEILGRLEGLKADWHVVFADHKAVLFERNGKTEPRKLTSAPAAR